MPIDDALDVILEYVEREGWVGSSHP